MSLIGQMVIIKYSEVETNLVSKISKSPDFKKKKKVHPVVFVDFHFVLYFTVTWSYPFVWWIND